MKKNLRLGTRGSPMALVQARQMRESILRLHPGWAADGGDVTLVPIRTTGDWRPEQKEKTFLEMGGNKGFFTKEIEQALLSGEVDLAVHCMKDVETNVPEGLVYTVFPERSDPRDVFVSTRAPTLEALPPGARIGTSSLRRQAQILMRRPDVRVVPFRGNADTRLRKLAEGEVDATILAAAGLERLGMLERVASFLERDVMLPAATQGALGVQMRAEDAGLQAFLAPLNHAPTERRVLAERALLAALDGSCRTPVAALAEIRPDGTMALEGLVAAPDGTACVRQTREGPAEDAVALGTELGSALRAAAPPGVLAA